MLLLLFCHMGAVVENCATNSCTPGHFECLSGDVTCCVHTDLIDVRVHAMHTRNWVSIVLCTMGQDCEDSTFLYLWGVGLSIGRFWFTAIKFPSLFLVDITDILHGIFSP